MRSLRIYLILLLLATSHPQTTLANEMPQRLLVLGDSLVAGYGLAPEESFPAQLERALRQIGHAVTVGNAGVSGDTTAGGLARLDWALADEPRLVIIVLGGNDALRGLPPQEAFANLEAIVERLSRDGIHIILAGMQAPRNLGEEYTRAFDAIYPQLAEQFGVAFYPFFLAGVALDPALNQADGIHPNAAGIAVIVGRMLPLIDSELRDMQELRGPVTNH